MHVEKRYSRRYPLTGDVYIRYRDKRSISAKAKNCSLYGIFLETAGLSLLTGTMVELELTLHGKHWKMDGLIVHSTNEGLGLMFLQPQPELFDEVKRLAEMTKVMPYIEIGTACKGADPLAIS